MRGSGIFSDLINEFGHEMDETKKVEIEATPGKDVTTGSPLRRNVGEQQLMAVSGQEKSKAMRIYEEEERESGGISWHTWRAFFGYCGSPAWQLLVFALLCLGQIAQVGTSL